MLPPLPAATLMALSLLLLLGGFGLALVRTPRRRIDIKARIGASAALVLAAWAYWLFYGSGGSASTYALLIAVGMTLGFVGDLFMAELITVKLPLIRHRVIGGMASFGLGHVAYIAACVTLIGAAGLDDDMPILLAAEAAWLIIGLIGWAIVVGRGERSILHNAALPYSLLLASTAGVATGIALQAPSLWPLALGAGLFLLSDLILAVGLFRNSKSPALDDAVWLTYIPGQLLIVASAALAAELLRSM